MHKVDFDTKTRLTQILNTIDSVTPSIKTTKLSNPIYWRQCLPEICSLDIPKRLGGKGFLYKEMGEVFLKLGYVDLNLRDVPGGGHGLILSLAKQEKFDHVLFELSKGNKFIAIAITEENAGSDLHGMTTIAYYQDNGFYKINGSKCYVARLKECTDIIVLCRTNRLGFENKLSAFLIPIDSKGITIEKIESSGLNAVSWGKINFNDVLVPANQIIGKENEGLKLFTKHFTYWRLYMAAACLGSARYTFDKAIEYLKRRKAFGNYIGRFNHFHQELAIHVSKLHSCYLLIQNSLERLDNKKPAVIDACIAKVEAVETSIDTISWAMNVFGARGYSMQEQLSKRLNDLYGMRIADGTRDVLRSQIARSIIGEKLYELSLNRKEKEKILKLSDNGIRKFW